MKNEDEINAYAKEIQIRVEENLGSKAYDIATKERGFAFIAGAKIALEYNVKGDTEEIREKQKYIIKNIMNSYSKDWRAQQKTPKNFQNLLSALRQLLKGNGIKKPEKALENAENIAAWVQPREILETVVSHGSEFYQKRIDKPITTFTKEQESQWCQIFSDDQENLSQPIKDKIDPNKGTPNWFKKLQPWEQNYHKSRLKEWANKVPLKNLGDFLGVPPTTIRGYPGIRNAYMSYVQTYNKEGVLIGEIAKIRSGHVSPDKMKNKDERLAVVKENIKQMILASAKEKIKNGETYLLFDLQTLISPPFDYTMDNDRLDAVTQLREELEGEKFKAFLELNVSDSEKPLPDNIQFKLLTSNYPVNVGRVAANFVNALATLISPAVALLHLIPGLSRYLPSPRRAYENSNTLSVLKERASISKIDLKNEFDTARTVSFNNKLKKIEIDHPEDDEGYKKDKKSLTEKFRDDYTSDWNFRWAQFQKGQAALLKIDEISGFQRISNALSGLQYGYKAINHNAERAALEQIAVSGLGGTRMGSCMSGKDREGAISIHVAAMELFYAKHKKFPPIPGLFGMSPEDEVLREEYEKMAAEHFIANHDQIIADANAPGAGGLKEVETILGRRIMAKIGQVLVDKYPKASETEKAHWRSTDFSNLTHAIASLNKPKSEIKPPKQWEEEKPAPIPVHVIAEPPAREKRWVLKEDKALTFTYSPDGQIIGPSSNVPPDSKPDPLRNDDGSGRLTNSKGKP